MHAIFNVERWVNVKTRREETVVGELGGGLSGTDISIDLHQPGSASGFF